jgi:hypothetical protein
MSTAIEPIMPALIAVDIELPTGTNLGLLHMLWMMVTGKGLLSRGALFPGLQASGLNPDAVHRAWAAFRYGVWRIADLMTTWYEYVQAQGEWQASIYEGYRVKAADITGFSRPALKQCPTKHYDGKAGKALPAIPIGLVAEVGRVGEQRIALPTAMVRARVGDPSEQRLKEDLLHQVMGHLGLDEVTVLDAGFKPSEVEAVRLSRVVLRLAKNATFRRNFLPLRKKRGRPPEYGDYVRPLARRRKKRRFRARQLTVPTLLKRMARALQWPCGMTWFWPSASPAQTTTCGKSSLSIIPITSNHCC